MATLAAVWFFWFSDFLAVSELTVKGCSALRAEQITDVAKVAVGTPMISVDETEIEARVAKIPEVKSVQVSTSWPNKVNIEIVERTPIYRLQVAGDFFWVDEDGVRFTSAKEQENLPLLQLESPNNRILRDVGAVVVSLSPELLNRLDRISANSPDTIELILTDESTVVWGSAHDSALKAKVATALLKTRAAVYDVSAPQNPTTQR